MMSYVGMITRSFQLVSRMGSRLPAAYISKRKAQRRFVQELEACGLPEEAVNRLSQAYKEMVSVNPMDYLTFNRSRRNKLHRESN